MRHIIPHNLNEPSKSLTLIGDVVTHSHICMITELH